MKIHDYLIKTVPVYKIPTSVQELIPIYRISEDGIFELENKPDGVKKQYDRAYLFEDANFSTMDDEEQESFFKQYCATLNSLNVSFKITVMNNNRDMDRVKKEVFLRCRNGRFKELVDSFNNHIEESLEKGHAGIEQARLFVISCSRESFDLARDYFRSVESGLALSFTKMNSALIPLNASERLRYLFAFYRMGEETEYRFHFAEFMKKKRDWKSYISPRVIKQCQDEYGRFDGKTVQIDGRFVRTLYLAKFPNKIDTDIIKKLMGGNWHVIFTIDVAEIPQEAVSQTLDNLYLQNSRAIEKQQEARNNAGAWSSDITYERRQEKEELEAIMDIHNNNDEKMSYAGVYAVVTAMSFSELEKDVVAFCQIAKENGFDFVPTRWCQIEAINTALPTGARFFEDGMRALLTQPLCAMVPFVVNELYHPGGIFYGINQVSKNVLIGDRKRLKNGNGFVLGVTGSGKSLFVKEEIAQVYLRTNDDIIVIDPQNEYRAVTEYFGGQYVEFGSGAGNYINPLDIGTLEYMEKDKFMVDKTQLMCSLFSQIKGEITSQERSLIGRCVKHLYEDNRTGRIKRDRSPTLLDFYEELGCQDEMLARELKLDLEIFVDGALDMFAKPTNVNIKNRLTVYGIADLGEEQNGIGMLIMLEGIRSRIAANALRGRATWLYIDEFHNMTVHQYTASFFEKIWKEVRKLGGICTAITQNIADCLALKTIETMLCNSEYIAFFNQSEIELEILSGTLRISDKLLECVEDSVPGCGLLKFGGGTYIPLDARIPKQSEMYALANTNFHEIQSQNQRQKRRNRKRMRRAMTTLPEDAKERIHDAPTPKESIYPGDGF